MFLRERVVEGLVFKGEKGVVEGLVLKERQGWLRGLGFKGGERVVERTWFLH